MRPLALALVLLAVVAGCGGSKQADVPDTALLTGVRAAPQEVVFEFASPPLDVTARFRPESSIAEAGSGAKVDVRGDTFLVVTFTPAATADIAGEAVVLTYKGPKRLAPRGLGPVQEVVKIGDFEAQLDWVIGLSGRAAYDVARDGDRVTVTFAG
jgi:hypothetical protein